MNVQASYGDDENSPGVSNPGGDHLPNSSPGQSWSAQAEATTYDAVKKKFCCPRCNRGYTRIYDMKTHYQFQCSKPPRYACYYCPQTNKFSSNMYNHVRKFHSNEQLMIIDLFKQLSRTSYTSNK